MRDEVRMWNSYVGGLQDLGFVRAFAYSLDVVLFGGVGCR